MKEAAAVIVIMSAALTFTLWGLVATGPGCPGNPAHLGWCDE